MSFFKRYQCVKRFNSASQKSNQKLKKKSYLMYNNVKPNKNSRRNKTRGA